MTKSTYIRTQEHKIKMSEIKKYYSPSEETKRKVSKIMFKLWQNPEYRQHMSEVHKGQKHTKEQNEKIGLANTGKKRTEETKRKIGNGNRAEKNGMWNNGSSFEPYGVEFNKELKEFIKQKYNYRCQECFRHQDELYSKNGKKRKLHIHHIDYNKQNNFIENLIPLCWNCHLQTNFNRNDWKDYFQERIYPNDTLTN